MLPSSSLSPRTRCLTQKMSRECPKNPHLECSAPKYSYILEFKVGTILWGSFFINLIGWFGWFCGEISLCNLGHTSSWLHLISVTASVLLSDLPELVYYCSVVSQDTQEPGAVIWCMQGMIPRPPFLCLCLNFSLRSEGKKFGLETILRKGGVVQA